MAQCHNLPGQFPLHGFRTISREAGGHQGRSGPLDDQTNKDPRTENPPSIPPPKPAEAPSATPVSTPAPAADSSVEDRLRRMEEAYRRIEEANQKIQGQYDGLLKKYDELKTS